MSLRSARDSPFARLASEVGAWRGGSTAMRLAASAREDSTTEGYARHWREFEGWCDEEGLDPLPATPQMIFAYVGALAEKGTIAASSLPALPTSRPSTRTKTSENLFLSTRTTPATASTSLPSATS